MLKNGTTMDGLIKDFKSGEVVLDYSQGEGSIEIGVTENRIENLLFKPIVTKESRKIEKKLKRKFPEMKFYTEGDITIITDSYPKWVKECQKTIRTTYTEIYLKFYPLFKNKKPARQNFIVIFDNYEDFVDHAIKDGIPGWAVLGYYHTEDKVLYLFNVIGDKFAKLIYEMFIGVTEKIIDEQVRQIKSQTDQRVHAVIDGQAKNIKDKYWRIYNLITSEARNETLSTLRHEFTHGIFSNWGIQNIKVSLSEKSKKKLNKKKKEIFESKDKETKQKWFENLLMLNKEGEPLEMKGANSWLVEGLATYCETYPIGKQNDRWLFLFQEMEKENKIYPVETLTFYKIGSFPGMYAMAMLNAYAQSWAFTTFLMEKYPHSLLVYMEKTASEIVRTDQEDLDLLLSCLGKDAKTIDQEFLNFMQEKYKQLEDPFVKQTVFIHNLFKEFLP